MNPQWIGTRALCVAAAITLGAGEPPPAQARIEAQPAAARETTRRSTPSRHARLTPLRAGPGEAERRPVEAPWLLIAVSLAAGCLGAAGAELLAPALRDRGEERWGGGHVRVLTAAGFAAAASVAMLTVEQPWASIAGIALVISACADAVLLARQWRGRAHAAEQERDQLRERLQTATHTFVEQIEGLRQAVLGAYATDAPQANASGASASSGTSRFEMTVNNVFSMARRTTAAAGNAPSLWDQVRAILTRRLGRAQVDEGTLAEIGGADAGVRQHIARDIARQWSNLAPAWQADDVRPESTLASLVNEIDGRIP